MQKIWVGTKAQAPNDEKPILRRLYKKEIGTADPTRLNAWYLGKKERERGWFWSLDDNHVLYMVLYTLTSLPMMPRPGTQPLVVSRADKIYFSALFASSLVRNNISNYLSRRCHSCFNSHAGNFQCTGRARRNTMCMVFSLEGLCLVRKMTIKNEKKGLTQ